MEGSYYQTFKPCGYYSVYKFKLFIYETKIFLLSLITCIAYCVCIFLRMFTFC